MQNSNSFGSGASAKLSMERLLLPEPNVNVFSVTFMTLYRALNFYRLRVFYDYTGFRHHVPQILSNNCEFKDGLGVRLSAE